VTKQKPAAHKFSKTLELKAHEYVKEENKKLLLAPLQSLSIFAAAAGIVALIFEVIYFSEHSTQLYISRVTSIAVAFFMLIISNTKLGKNHPTLFVHILLLSIIMSFGVMIYLEPKTVVFNSHIISLIIFTAALFLSWEVSNQIVVAVYYNIVFITSIVLSSTPSALPHLIESVVLLLIISVIAVVASYINYRLRHDSFLKAYEVQLSEKKYRNLFENSAEGIFQISSKGKLEIVNPAFTKMLGYQNDDEITKVNFIDNLFKRKADWELLSKLLEKQGKVRNYRVLFNKKDGTEITVRLNVRLNYDEEMGGTVYEGSMQDITQQVQAEMERQKALDALRHEKMKSDIAARKAQQESSYKTKFLANMSHEVRTPMNSVMGFLTLIENDLFESKEELKGFARDAKMAAESLLDIINNILDISKIEAGKMELDEVDFSIHEEIHKVFSIIGQAAKQKGIFLESEIDEKLPSIIFGDSTRYRQIILNLVNNAVKFTDEGKVSVKVLVNSISGFDVEIKTIIEDTGHGIPSDRISLLFEPFVQVRNKKGTKEGTGLGLVIAKEFVKLMGGEIDVESKVGSGSRFYFTVKMRLKGETDVIEGTPTDESTELLNEIILIDEAKTENSHTETSLQKKILLVEDNPISQNLELKILREVGYNVEAVSSGQEAIDAVESGLFKLVLMDVEMNDMDGLTATKKIRSIPGSIGKIPIIAVTAHSSMKDREKCLAAGMNDYIAKPINIHFLKLTIDQWLNTSPNE